MRSIILTVLTFLTLTVYAQRDIKVEMTESYELANIILALTQYGRTDKWDVQKVPPYYDRVLQYFEPVKDHPLLDSVNYSRADWKKFLGFRTDMYAFSFDQNGRLKRDYPFNSFGPQEVDKNIDLINDFVLKSNYRKFYRDHALFYDTIVSHYKAYYLLDQSKTFLDKIAEKPKSALARKYIIAISPLVGGQNCHRDIDSLTTVDFPNISPDLIVGRLENNPIRRVVDNHSLFTEMNHGYINPISDKYAGLIASHFDPQKWDKGSGYEGISNFNEYMTWAVYDLFIKEAFPKVADSIALQWQYQNASRGFMAQNLFSDKLSQLYFSSKRNQNLEDLYPAMLKWCKSIEGNISQPTLLHVDKNSFVKADISNLQLAFSEPMDTRRPFSIQVLEAKEGRTTGKESSITILKPQWSKDGKKVSFGIDTAFEEFALFFNWWGIDKPLVSKNGILLEPKSYVLLKK